MDVIRTVEELRLFVLEVNNLPIIKFTLYARP